MENSEEKQFFINEANNVYIRIVYSKRKSMFETKLKRQRNFISELQKSVEWSRHFAQQPKLLIELQKYYCDDGKRLCIQYCEGNNQIYEKDRFVVKSKSLQ